MIHKSICVIFIAVTTVFAESYTPGTDQYLLTGLADLLNPANGLLFDGPASTSNAETIETNNNKLPTLEQLQYYFYYCAATYYAYGHKNLTCEYCLKFSDHVDQHRGNIQYKS